MLPAFSCAAQSLAAQRPLYIYRGLPSLRERTLTAMFEPCRMAQKYGLHSEKGLIGRRHRPEAKANVKFPFKPMYPNYGHESFPFIRLGRQTYATEEQIVKEGERWRFRLLYPREWSIFVRSLLRIVTTSSLNNRLGLSSSMCFNSHSTLETAETLPRNNKSSIQQSKN